MRTISINIGRDGPRVSVRETETPGAWELEWTGDVDERQAWRMLRASETVVLQNDGERVVLTCGSDQEALRGQLEKWFPEAVSRTGERYRLELLIPGSDGYIHDDDDFRTPLHRLTCPTCVRRIAESRTQARQEAMAKRPGPRAIAEHSRRIAEAYARLAEIEETLEI